jgi:hypothetical protein
VRRLLYANSTVAFIQRVLRRRGTTESVYDQVAAFFVSGGNVVIHPRVHSQSLASTARSLSFQSLLMN